MTVRRMSLREKEAKDKDSRAGITKLEYRGYWGSFSYDKQDNMFRGAITNYLAIIEYEGHNLDELERSFCAGIELYLKDCRKRDTVPAHPSTFYTA